MKNEIYRRQNLVKGIRTSQIKTGGAIPPLLNHVLKEPVTQGGFLGANTPVGIISKSITAKPPAQSTITSGGELLNSIAFHKPMRKGEKKVKDNIKFLF